MRPGPAALLCAFLLLSPSIARSQTTPNNVVRSYDLNVQEKRIVEERYSASLAARFEPRGPRDPSLFAGIDVRAQRIDLVLRGIRGHVDFRASLDELQSVIDRHAALSQNPH